MKKIREIAELVFERHQKAYEEWPHGNIVEAWNDDLGFLCVKYENGQWW